jgi:ribonuclease VapC
VTLDTSALIAVLFAEPGYLELVDAMLEADTLRVGAPTVVEASLVARGRQRRSSGRSSDTLVTGLITELGVTVVPFGEAEWRRAAEAFMRFGRGQHKASLNFGDCLAYATAAVAGDSLLFVGDDFRHTDVQRAL